MGLYFPTIILVSCIVGFLDANSPDLSEETHVFRRQADSPCAAHELHCESYIYGIRAEICLDSIHVCDTETNCINGTDEDGCPTGCTGSHQFQCVSDSKCMPIYRRCNGRADCKDGSDEAHCSSHRCASGFTKCTDHIGCYKDNRKCDGVKNCRDASDESSCSKESCDEGQFHCEDKKHCIPEEYKCDFENDCLDSSDEKDCTHETCDHALLFKCDNGRCLARAYTCDRNNDCGDNSDEAKSVCHGEIPEDVCADLMQYESCHHLNETAYPICSYAVDAKKLCKKFCKLCDDTE